MTTSTEPTLQEWQHNINFIVYYRKDTQDREFNLKQSVHYLFTKFPKSLITIIHDGPAPDTDFVKYLRNCPLNVKASFIENHGEFRKSQAYNVGAEATQAPVLCFWDVDVLIDERFIHKAYTAIVEGHSDHVYPFNGTFVDVQKDLFSDFLTRYNFSHVEKLWNAKHPSLHFASSESPGGCTMIGRGAFVKMGGYDDRFIGWGFEDTDFLYRSRKVNRVAYLQDENAICWHLHHDNAKRMENPHYHENLRIFNHNAAC